MKKDEAEKIAPAAGADVGVDGKPLPEWTKRYPAEERQFLASCGVPPDSYPRAHEAILRLIEVGQVFDRGSPALSARLARDVFCTTIDRTIANVGGRPNVPTMEELIRGEAPPPPLPARLPEEIEVRSDWLDMYPPEYRPLLAQWGVRTIAGTQVDAFNRHLIELVPPDCTDHAVLQRSAGSALLRAFWSNWIALFESDDEAYWDAVYGDLDLEDVCWATYAAEHRALLGLLGRPDYEHPAAAAYNRALIAAARALRTEGLGDEAIERLRRHLWSEFFGETLCPEQRGDRDVPIANGDTP